MFRGPAARACPHVCRWNLDGGEGAPELRGVRSGSLRERGRPAHVAWLSAGDCVWEVGPGRGTAPAGGRPRADSRTGAVCSGALGVLGRQPCPPQTFVWRTFGAVPWEQGPAGVQETGKCRGDTCWVLLCLQLGLVTTSLVSPTWVSVAVLITTGRPRGRASLQGGTPEIGPGAALRVRHHPRGESWWAAVVKRVGGSGARWLGGLGLLA